MRRKVAAAVVASVVSALATGCSGTPATAPDGPELAPSSFVKPASAAPVEFDDWYASRWQLQCGVTVPGVQAREGWEFCLLETTYQNLADRARPTPRLVPAPLHLADGGQGEYVKEAAPTLVGPGHRGSTAQVWEKPVASRPVSVGVFTVEEVR